MELTPFLRIIARRWWLVVIPILIASGLALPELLANRSPVSGGFAIRFSYSAAQNLTAIPRSEGDYQDIWLSSELTVNALTDWVTSSSFASEVSVNLEAQGMMVSMESLLGRIAADNERSVGHIFMTWPDAAQLAAIGEAALVVLQTRNADYFAQLGGTPATVTILDAPRVEAAPPPLTDRLGPVLRVGLGLLAGIGLALIAHSVDPVLRRKEDVEALGLPVIATIPRR
jgi:capsular polysaccharide biosynthesis protein